MSLCIDTVLMFFVDNLAPTLTSFDLDENLLDSGIVKFSFSVEDRACNDPSCAGNCSGISKVELFEQDNSFQEIININTNSCTISNTFDSTISLFSEGQHTVFAKAFDKFNQVSPVLSVNFELDKTPPSIVLSTFKITDETDLDISFIQPIFTFGKLTSASSAAHFGVLAEEANLKRKQEDVRLTVRKLYWALVLGKELLAVVEDAKKELSKAESKIEEKLDEGSDEVSQTDLFKLQIFNYQTMPAM